VTSLPFFQVDAFAERPLTGNPAAVLPLERWLDDTLLQAIAAENNLSETAFTIPSERDDADYELRWFTPTDEVELCGHATLAAGHVLGHSEPVRFATRKAGVLSVARRGSLLELDLPNPKLTEVHEPALNRSLGLPDGPAWLADGCNDAAIIELPDEAAVRAVRVGAAPGQDAADRVRAACRHRPAASGSGQAGDVRLPGLYAHLCQSPQRAVLGAAYHDRETDAGEAGRGQDPAQASHA